MSESVVPDFPPVVATNPIERPPVPAGVDDVWALDMLQIRRNESPAGTKFSMLSAWSLGRMIDGNWVRAVPGATRTANIVDLLSPETLVKNPEIAEIATPFFTALSAVCKRAANL